MKQITVKDIPSYCAEEKTVDIGDGYVVKIETPYDEHHGAPWEECDGHGPVSEWTTRDKAPGERILATDRHSRRYYDFAEAVKIARRDGWDTKPYNTGTKGERAHRAAEADFEYLRRWCNEQWRYIGVCVTVYRNGAEIGQDSLWGIEDDGDYWKETAAELVNEVIHADEVNRKIAAKLKAKETRERNYWNARDVVTV